MIRQARRLSFRVHVGDGKIIGRAADSIAYFTCKCANEARLRGTFTSLCEEVSLDV